MADGDPVQEAWLGGSGFLTAFAEVFHRDIGDGLIVVEVVSQRFIGMNDAYCRMVGYTHEELIGKTPWELDLFPYPDELEGFMSSASGTFEPVTGEIHVRRKDGRIALTEALTRFTEIDGRMVALGVARDITERRASEEALKRSEAAARTLFEQNPVPMWVWDPVSLKPLDVNEAALEQYGYTREEFLAMSLPDLLLDGKDERSWTSVAAAPDHDELTYVGSWKHLRKDGEELIADVWSKEISRGDTSARISIAIDATERVRAEAALKEAEQRYRQLFQSIPACVSLERVSDQKALYIGPFVEELLGYPMDDWHSGAVTWRAIVHPADRDRVLTVSDELDVDPRRYSDEYRVVASDGRVVWVRDESVPLFDAEGRLESWLGFWVDVTAQHEASAALEEAEERFRLLVESLPAVVWMEQVDASGADYVSPGVVDMLGYPLEFWEQKFSKWKEIIHPDDRERIASQYRELVAEPRPYVTEFRVRTKDGRDMWIRDQATPIFSEDGALRRWQGVWIDITDQKRAEMALREAEERYRVLVEALPAVVWLEHIDPPGTDYISPKVVEIFGYPLSLWYENTLLWRDLIHPEDRDQLLADYADLIADPKPYVKEFRMLAKDGRVVWIRDQATPIADEQGVFRRWQGLWTDITEQREAEAALRQAEEAAEAERRRAEEDRRDLLARLVAAGEAERRRIADDLHDAPIQSLTALQLRLEGLRSHIDGDGLPLVERSLETVTSSIRSLRAMMFDLQPRILERDGLEAALRAHLATIREDAGIDVVIRSSLDQEPPADARSILYRIAQEALANARKHSRAKRVEVAIERSDGGFQIRIEDDGIGFDPSVEAAPGHIGLAAMRDRAELAGGRLRIERGREGGTSVLAWVPGPPQTDGSGVP